jgi:hypothetical protein
MKNSVQGVIERRKTPLEDSTWWEKLSLAQKFSASSLSQFGYDLNFIRYQDGKSLAVLQCNNGIAIISEDGEINTSPHVYIRATEH